MEECVFKIKMFSDSQEHVDISDSFFHQNHRVYYLFVAENDTAGLEQDFRFHENCSVNFIVKYDPRLDSDRRANYIFNHRDTWRGSNSANCIILTKLETSVPRRGLDFVGPSIHPYCGHFLRQGIVRTIVIKCFCNPSFFQIQHQPTVGVTLTNAPRLAIELWGAFIRQPIMMPVSRFLYTAVFLAFILITWNYEFFLVSELVALPKFREFRNIIEMKTAGYRVWHQRDASVSNEVIKGFAGIRHDPIQAFMEKGTFSYLELLGKLGHPGLKLAIVFATFSVRYMLAVIRSVVGEWTCYGLKLNGSSYVFEYMELANRQEFQGLIRLYTEAGFRKVWLKWDMFRWDLAGFKQKKG